MSAPTKFPHFQNLPIELQILIANHLPCDTYLMLLRSSRHTHSLLSNSPYLTRRAAQISLHTAYHVDWRTPLHVAAAASNLPLLTAILSSCTHRYATSPSRPRAQSTSPTARSSCLFSAPSPCLHARAAAGELLRYGAKAEKPQGIWWGRFEAPLMYEVKLRDYEIMRVLMKAGVDPGAVEVSRYEPGPLWLAVIEEDVRALELLLRLSEWRDGRAWKVVMRYVADTPETADMAKML